MSEDKQDILQPASDPTTAPPSSAGSLAGSSFGGPPDTVKLSQVLRQGQPGEVKLMTEADYQAAHNRHKKIVGDPPGAGEEPTREQLTVLLTAVMVMGSTHTDFAIWTPFGHRNLARQRVQGKVFGSDGKLMDSEQLGPANYQEWLRCYTIFHSACLMLDLIGDGRLKRYAAKIYQATLDYPGCWALTYQADVRTRRERVGWVKYLMSQMQETVE